MRPVNPRGEPWQRVGAVRRKRREGLAQIAPAAVEREPARKQEARDERARLLERGTL